MATKFGSVWAQWVGWLGSSNASHTHQVNPNNRSVTIKSGITLHKAGGGSHWADAGVFRIVSNGQFEEFDPPVPNISRNNVTQIVLMTRASGCWARASHEITYWN